MTDDARMEERLREYRDDLRFIMDSKSGRRVVYGILQSSGLWQSGPPQDQQTNEFLCGMRHVGLMLYRDLDKFCFAERQLMEMEAHDVRRTDSDPEPGRS